MIGSHSLEILEMLDKMDETQLDHDDFGNDDRSDGEESIHADQRMGSELKYPSKPSFDDKVQARYDELNRELIDRKSELVDAQIEAEEKEYEARVAAGEVFEEDDEESTDYEAMASKLENEQKASQTKSRSAAKKKENRS